LHARLYCQPLFGVRGLQPSACPAHQLEEVIMSNAIPPSFLDLFKKKAFGHLGTLMPDGSPQVTPVWVDYDGQNVLINTAAERQKDRNLQRDGRVAISIIDPDNAYRYLEVRGHVVERTTQGADAHIDSLAKRYIGQDKYPWRRPGEQRVIFKVRAEHTTHMG
jgi:PPOX class probable F420-dependent enzyme